MARGSGVGWEDESSPGIQVFPPKSRADCVTRVALLERLGGVDHRLRGDAEHFHDLAARGAEAETVDADDLAVEADVFPPEAGDSGLDGDALAAGRREDFILVGLSLLIEAMEARDADDTDTFAKL